jgi:hypothetical protein
MPPGIAPPPPKKKTGLIIAIVVGVLLLCCCLASVAAGLLFFSTDSTSTGTKEVSEEGLKSLPEAEADPRVTEWLDWNPAGPAMLDAMPSAMERFASEGMEMLAPDFTAEEAVWRAGYYDAAEDWYYADAVFVRATHPSADNVYATIEMWIQSDQMLAEDVAFDPQEDEIVTTIDGGARELIYWAQWGDGFRLETGDHTALWEQLGKDWPEATVVQLQADGNQYSVELTKWELYAVDGSYPYVWATYAKNGSDWELVEWQYHEADEAATTES